MNIGETIEVCAIWLAGTETPEHFRQFHADVEHAMKSEAARYNLGPLVWTEKKPGDERVPPVPKHIDGPNVRLLVGEAVIVSLRPSMKTPVGFVHDLEPSDHALLRRITRRVRQRMFPNEGRLTDRQCDTILNDLGPAAAVETLKNLKRSDLI